MRPNTRRIGRWLPRSFRSHPGGQQVPACPGGTRSSRPLLTVSRHPGQIPPSQGSGTYGCRGLITGPLLPRSPPATRASPAPVALGPRLGHFIGSSKGTCSVCTSFGGRVRVPLSPSKHGTRESWRRVSRYLLSPALGAPTRWLGSGARGGTPQDGETSSSAPHSPGLSGWDLRRPPDPQPACSRGPRWGERHCASGPPHRRSRTR